MDPVAWRLVALQISDGRLACSHFPILSLISGVIVCCANMLRVKKRLAALGSGTASKTPGVYASNAPKELFAKGFINVVGFALKKS